MLKNVLFTSLVCFSLAGIEGQSATCTDTVSPGASFTYNTAPTCNIVLQGNNSTGSSVSFNPGSAAWNLDGYIQAIGVSTCIDSNTDLLGSILVNTGSLNVSQGVSVVPGCSSSIYGAISLLSSSGGTLVLGGSSTSAAGSIFYLGDKSSSSGTPGRVSIGLAGNSAYKPFGDSEVRSIATGSSILVTQNLTLNNPVYIKSYASSGVLLDVVSGSTLTLSGAVTLENATASDYFTINSQNASYTGTVLFTGIPTIGNLKASRGIVQFNVAPTGAGTFLLDTATLQFGETFSLPNSYTVQLGNTSSGFGVMGVSEAKTATVDALITTGSLKKVGLGVLILTNTANSYSGGTTIEEGKLSITNASQLGSGNVSLATDGTLQVLASTTMTKNITVIDVGNIRVGGGSQLTINGGVIGGSGTLDIFGIGTVSLLTPMTFSGDLGLSCATLECSINNAMSSSTDLGITSGKLNLNGFNLALASMQVTGGVVDLGSATLTISGGGKVSAPAYVKGTGNVSLTSSGTMDLSNSNNVFSGSLTVGSGASLLLGSSGNLQNASSLVIQGGGSLKFKTGKTMSLGMPMTLNTGTAAIDVSSSKITLDGVIGGSGLLEVRGTSGSLFLTGTNTFSGGLNLAGGTLSIGNSANLVGGSTLTFTGGAFSVTSSFSKNLPMVFSLPASLSISSGQTFTNTGILSGPNGFVILGGGALSLTGVSSTFSGEVEIASGKLQISGPSNLGSGTGALFFNSATASGSLLEVTGSGTFSRPLRGTSGTVSVGSSQNVTFSAGVFSGTLVKEGPGGFTLSSATSPIPNIEVNGGEFVSNGSTLSSSAITLGLGTRLRFNQSSSGTYSGVISGSGDVSIEGAAGNVLTMTSSNIYTGSTTLSGSVSIASSEAFGSGPLVFNGGTLFSTGDLLFAVEDSISLNGSTTTVFSPGRTPEGTKTTITLDPLITGTGGLSVNGDGTLVLSHPDNVFTGSVVIEKGTLAIPVGTVLGNAIGDDAVNFKGGILKALLTLTVNRSLMLTKQALLETDSGVTFSLSGKISGGFGIDYSGDGIIALSSGSSTFTGPINMMGAGTLDISSSGALGNTSSVNMAGASTFRVSADGLTINKSIVLTGAASSSVDFDVDQLGSTNITTTFSGPISGSGSLSKIGAGSLLMTGTASYTGGTHLTGGTFSIGSTANLPTVGALYFNGGILAVRNTLTTPLNMDLNSADANFSIPTGQVLTASGILSGSNGIIFSGGGTLELAGSNTFQGKTTITTGVLKASSGANLGGSGSIILSGGTLLINGSFETNKGFETLNGTVQVDGSYVATFTGIMDSSTGSTLIKSGTGQIVLNPLSQASIPNVTISQGVLSGSTNILASSRIDIASGSTLTFSQTSDGTFTGSIGGAGSFSINATSPSALLIMGSTSSNNSTGGVILSRGGLSIARESSLGSSASITASGGRLVASDTFSLSKAISLTAATNTTFSVVSGKTMTITGSISGSGGITIGDSSSTGTVFLNSGSNTSTGGLTHSYGTLQFSSGSALGNSTNTITAAGGKFYTAVNVTALQPMVLAAGVNTMFDVLLGTTLSWNGPLSGSGDFTMIGNGTFALGGTNTYSGTATLSSGFLAIGAATNLSSLGRVAFQGGTLSLTSTMTLPSSMNFSSTNGLFSVSSGQVATLSGLLSGDFGLELTGSGTLALTGSNTFFGDVKITSGILTVSNDSNLGNASLVNLNGGTLKFTGGSFVSAKTLSSFKGVIQVDSGSATFTGSMTPSAGSTFTKTGLGDLFFLPEGQQTSIPTAVISAGSLTGNTYILETSQISVATGSQIVFAQTENGTFKGPSIGNGITGDGALYIKGTSGVTLSMTSANTHAGGTYLNSGILSIASVSPLGNTSSSIFGQGGDLKVTANITVANPFNLSAGTTSLVVDSGKTLTWTGSISGSSSLSATGLGTVYLNPTLDNTNTGGIDLVSGILQISKESSLGNNSNVLTGSGGELYSKVSLIASQPIYLRDGTVTRINVDTNATLSLQGVISSFGGLYKAGSGILALKAANTYEGGTTIAAGTVSLEVAENLPCGFSVAFEGGTLNPLDSMTLNIPMLFTANANFLISSGKVVGLSGVLSGDQGFIQQGGGALLLSASNTFFGNIQVSGSTLQFSTDLNLANATSLILDTSTLEVVASASTIDSSKGFQKLIATTIDVSDNTVTFTGSLSNLDRNSSITKLGDGTLKLLPLTGESLKTLTLSEGSFVGNSFSLASTTITTSSLTEIAFYQEQNGTFSGTISGAGSFKMTGTLGSVLSLTNSQSYSGGLTLQSGMYSVSKDNQLGSSGVEIFAVGFDGALQATDTFSTSRYLTFIDAGVTVDVQNNGSRKSTLTFTSSVTGDTLTKTGPGTLALDGITTVTSYVVVDEGTLYVGGVMQGSTPPESSSFSSSSFESFSAPASLSVEVGSAGTLLGEGEINADVVVSGIIAGGDGFNESTLTINGNVSMESGSTLGVRINPLICSNLLVEGDFMIDSFSRALILPSPGVYPKPQVLNLLDVGGTISGQFNSADVPEVLFMTATLDYSNPSSISVTVTPLQIFPEVTGRNADAVATSLDNVIDWNRLNVSFTLPLVDTVSNALLPGVLRSLMPLASYPNKMTNTLNKMQPAALKGLVIAQESASIEVRGALSSRMQNALDTKSCYAIEDGSCKDDTKRVHIWLSGMGNVLNQKSNTYNHSPQVGYQSKLVGTVAGVDAHFLDYFYAGALGGYTNSHINWKENRGHGDVNTGYGGLYLSFLGEMFYGNASIIGGWSSYNTTRNIFYPGVHETAKGQRQGRELLSHIDTGINLGFSGFTVRPFDSFDYLAGVENSYEETGARDWNLRIRKSNAIMLRNELGLQFAGCVCVKESKWTVSPKVSWVREVRVKGSHYRASFAGASEFPFTVTGYFPSRNLFSPGLMIAGTMYQDRLGINFTYDGEFTGGYSAHKYTAEARFGF